MSECLLKMESIHKRFLGVTALDNVDLMINKGEIHALLGENGAGKSTLVKILGGVHMMDTGQITFNGEDVEEVTPDVSKKLGIGFVHQELNLAEHLSVAENIFIGRIPEKKFGLIDFKKLHHDTSVILKQLDVNFSSQTIVGDLTTANKQLVEIAKAISLEAQIIIFDEPTTSLSDKDVDNLFKIIRRLKEKNISSIYISHRMKEIFELCDRATVLRDGKLIGVINVPEVTNDEIIRMIVGRELKDLYPKVEVPVGNKVLEVENLSDKKGAVQNVSFFARKGEVLGISGLVGSGRTEMVRMLFGADDKLTGSIKINGKTVQINSPVEAINQGICLLTEDRKQQGLLLGMSILDNINITNLNDKILKPNQMQATAEKFVEMLDIRISNINHRVSSLSGGNQQKVVLGKWLNKDAQIFIFDEPTKGIDVGAKREIYEIINELVARGKTVIVISSEIPELQGITDRLYVMCEGKITGELNRSNADAEEMMRLSTVGGRTTS